MLTIIRLPRAHTTDSRSASSFQRAPRSSLAFREGNRSPTSVCTLPLLPCALPTAAVPKLRRVPPTSRPRTAIRHLARRPVSPAHAPPSSTPSCPTCPLHPSDPLSVRSGLRAQQAFSRRLLLGCLALAPSSRGVLPDYSRTGVAGPASQPRLSSLRAIHRPRVSVCSSWTEPPRWVSPRISRDGFRPP